MLRRKQKEFAVQSIMGMEQKTIGRLFFAETFVMGMISIAIGILLGVLCSQFITAMLLTSYGKKYELSWTLFPDTVVLTVCFFVLSYLVVGLFNTRTIRKTKIVDSLDGKCQLIYISPDLEEQVLSESSSGSVAVQLQVGANYIGITGTDYSGTIQITVE